MSCFACFTTSFKHYHFENFTFTQSSRRNTLDHHSHFHPLPSFTSRHSRRIRKHSAQQIPARHERRRLSKRGIPPPRRTSVSTAGHGTSVTDSSLGRRSPRGPSSLRNEVKEEEHPAISSILNPTTPARQAPKAPARVSFAHVTVQRQVTSI